MPVSDNLLAPIPGDNPSGQNLRYAPVYDQIKEARREDADIAQGEWQHQLKKADWPLVIKLCTDVLAKKTKDLQIAAWLTEAWIRKQQLAGLLDGLDLLRALVETFWDTLYPEIEDDDLELRATPLEWVGSRLDEPVKRLKLTRSGFDWFKYKESRATGYEGDPGMAEKRATAIEEGKLTPEEFDAAFDETPGEFYSARMQEVDACLASLEALNGLAQEKFGSDAPNMAGMRKTLDEVKQSVHVLLTKKRQQGYVDGGDGTEGGDEEDAALQQAQAQVAAYRPQPVPVSGGAAAAPARAAAPPRSMAAEPADREDAFARVAAVAKWLRANDAYSPVPYLLVRALRWGELRAGGAEPDPALLTPPATEVRQELKRLAAEGLTQELLEAAETAASDACGRAWLDAHRYAARACDELGYTSAAVAIRSELKALLADMPSVAESSLADDTPAANADTRAWIAEFAAPAQPSYTPPTQDWYSEPEQPRSGDEEGVERPPDAYELATQALRSGDAQQAIEILTREAAQESSGRARFTRKVQLAEICLGAGQPGVALPILESLADEIEKRALEEWEAPDTVAHALTLLYRAMQNQEASPEECKRIYSRICRLDPVQALGLAR